MNTCVVGLGHGDEGKGKITDIVSERHDVVVRYNGGANAGHTVVHGNKKYKLHHLPCGVISGKDGIIAAGTVLNPVALEEEIKTVPGLDESSLFVSQNAHCVMPWHLAADIRKGGKIGTTKKGIGPCYADKMHRWNAIRMGDLRKTLEDEKMQRFFSVDEAFHGSGLWDTYHDAAIFLEPYIRDTEQMLRKLVKQGVNILFESANGIHLDIDHGTFPYVTSSGVGPAAIPQACGLPNLHLDRIIGVIKCYATRVGAGPFPSELTGDETDDLLSSGLWQPLTNNQIAHKIREKGQEFGTTTGRPRRIGWFDLDLTKRAVELTGATEVALMHADTLAGMGSIGVWENGENSAMDGWQKKLEEQPFHDFVSMIEQSLEIPVTFISYGPDKEHTIIGDR